MDFFTQLKELWRGKDTYRLFMNAECANHRVFGKVLDIGSGYNLASYHRFLQKAPSTDLHFLDLSFALGIDDEKLSVDLEKDALPYEENSIDGVLLFNVLEHIFNYNQVIAESRRVLKPGGRLLGVVPFLVNYHPDPRDYWRYTKETLLRIIGAAGFGDVKVISFGSGPCVAAWSHCEQMVPKFLKIVIFPLVLAGDRLVKYIRPNMNKDKFPLGYFFSATK